MVCSAREEISEKELVAVSDSAAAKTPKDLHYMHSIVNQPQMMRLSLCCAGVIEVATIIANVQYLPPSA